MTATVRNPIIAALDVASADKAAALATQLAPAVGAFKIGSELFTAHGPEIVRRLRATGAHVFLDLKFHDIPNTVAKAIAAAVHLNVQMLTVHTSGGLEMMRAAEEAAQKAARDLGQQPPLVLGVTVLTSLSSAAMADLGYPENIGQQVERFAALAIKAGLRGLVCSPLELVTLRQSLPREIQLVTPGIRGPGDIQGDQKRTLSAKEALCAGANWLVIGRPIYDAANPREAAENILRSLS